MFNWYCSEVLPTQARPSNTDLSYRRIIIESRFLEVIGEPGEIFLNWGTNFDQAPRKHDFACGGVGERNFKETLLSRAKGASARVRWWVCRAK